MLTPAHNFTDEQYEEAYQAANNLRTLFQTAPNSYIDTSAGPILISREKWKQMLFSFAPHGIYEVLGSMWDGEEFPYIPVYLLSPEEVRQMQELEGKTNTQDYFKKVTTLKKDQELPPLRTLHSYEGAVTYALERAAGIAILPERDVHLTPSASFTLGEIAAYYTFGHHGGSSVMQDLYDKAFSIDQDDPMNLVVSEPKSRLFFELQPNDMVSDFILNEMTREISRFFPAAKPEYKLFFQDHYAMKYSLCIILNEAPDIDRRLTRILSWMVPSYLSLSILSKEEYKKLIA